MRWLVFLHIIGAMLYVGGAFTMAIVALKASRLRDAASLVRAAEVLGPAIGAGAVLTLVSGIVAVLVNPGWNFSMMFISGGFLILIGAGAIEGLYTSKKRRVLQAAIENGEADTAEVADIANQVARVSVAVAVLFLVAVWLMVFKPT